MPSPSPISALTVQPARSTVGAALRPLPGFGVNRDFFFLVVSQYPVSIDSYPIKHRGHAGLSLGLMSPLFDGEPDEFHFSVEAFGDGVAHEAARKRGVRFGRPRKLALDQGELARRLVSEG